MTKKKETRIWLNKRDYSLKLYNFNYISSAKLQNLSPKRFREYRK